MYKAKFAVCSEIRAKLSAQCDHIAELFNLKTGGNLKNH
jgi:hypothetical protein